MNVLIVKTSSFGDLIHTLPAVSDAKRALPGVEFTWVVEETFAAIPGWHRDVAHVMPVALRRWRGEFRRAFGGEIQSWWRSLRSQHYDRIVDAQGLIRSALIARAARGRSFGYADPRERIAARLYHERVAMRPRAHMIDRARTLFAAALDYEPTPPLDYGIDADRFAWPAAVATDPRYLLFAHGTTWSNKLWPETYWQQLASLAAQSGYRVLLPWGSELERARADRLALAHERVERLPRLSLDELAALLARAAGVVAVDTGLAHLCAALGTLCVSLWGPTDPELAGPMGPHQHHLRADFPCSPCMARHCDYRGTAAVTPACFATLPPERVWSTLSRGFEDAAQ